MGDATPCCGVPAWALTSLWARLDQYKTSKTPIQHFVANLPRFANWKDDPQIA